MTHMITERILTPEVLIALDELNQASSKVIMAWNALMEDESVTLDQAEWGVLRGFGRRLAEVAFEVEMTLMLTSMVKPVVVDA